LIDALGCLICLKLKRAARYFSLVPRQMSISALKLRRSCGARVSKCRLRFVNPQPCFQIEIVPERCQKAQIRTALRRSSVPFSRTGRPGRNFIVAGFGVASV
jgi:hypothetical protein